MMLPAICGGIATLLLGYLIIMTVLWGHDDDRKK